jgi:hypothetical protein
MSDPGITRSIVKAFNRLTGPICKEEGPEAEHRSLEKPRQCADAMSGGCRGFQFGRAVKRPSVLVHTLFLSRCCRFKQISESRGVQ